MEGTVVTEGWGLVGGVSVYPTLTVGKTACTHPADMSPLGLGKWFSSTMDLRVWWALHMFQGCPLPVLEVHSSSQPSKEALFSWGL